MWRTGTVCRIFGRLLGYMSTAYRDCRRLAYEDALAFDFRSVNTAFADSASRIPWRVREQRLWQCTGRSSPLTQKKLDQEQLDQAVPPQFAMCPPRASVPVLLNMLSRIIPLKPVAPIRNR